MAKVGLVVMGDGRKDFLARTIEGLKKISYEFDYTLISTDGADMDYCDYLIETYPDFDQITSLNRLGLSGNVGQAWEVLGSKELDYVFHVEEDFVMEEDIDINLMIEALESDPNLLQVTLKRQPCNPEELAAGGFIQANPNAYTQMDGYVEQSTLFSLNPCVYRASLMEYGWPNGGGEREFTDMILASNPNAKFGIFGTIDDPSRVDHIGNYRSGGWKV